MTIFTDEEQAVSFICKIFTLDENSRFIYGAFGVKQSLSIVESSIVEIVASDVIHWFEFILFLGPPILLWITCMALLKIDGSKWVRQVAFCCLLAWAMESWLSF